MVSGRALLLCFASASASRMVKRGGHGSSDKGVEATALQVCGVKGPGGINPLIINGSDADACEWRWQLSLQECYGGFCNHYCGAALISENWVLTAAQCVTHYSTGEYMAPSRVVAGVHNRSVVSGDTQTRTASVGFLHPGWYKAGPHNIALLRLDTPMNLGTCVGTVCLPAANEDAAPGTRCTITGFGRTESPPFRDILQEVEMEVVDQQDCIKSWKEKYHPKPWIPSDSDICISATGAVQSSACRGDIGGPLVVATSSGWTLFGVASFADSENPPFGVCSSTDLPNVYTSVHAHWDWIQETMAAA